MTNQAAFLTRDEVVELTGYRLAKCQINWLVKNGVRHWVPRTGRPIVPRSAIDGIQNSNDDLQSPEPCYVR